MRHIKNAEVSTKWSTGLATQISALRTWAIIAPPNAKKNL